MKQNALDKQRNIYFITNENNFDIKMFLSLKSYLKKNTKKYNYWPIFLVFGQVTYNYWPFN